MGPIGWSELAINRARWFVLLDWIVSSSLRNGVSEEEGESVRLILILIIPICRTHHPSGNLTGGQMFGAFGRFVNMFVSRKCAKTESLQNACRCSEFATVGFFFKFFWVVWKSLVAIKNIGFPGHRLRSEYGKGKSCLNKEPDASIFMSEISGWLVGR